MGILAVAMLGLIRAVVLVWGVLTSWAYRLLGQDAAARVKAASRVLARPVRPVRPGDTEATFVPVPGHKTPIIVEFESAQCETMADVWDWSVRRCASHLLLFTVICFQLYSPDPCHKVLG
jgi:hypothetical protein